MVNQRVRNAVLGCNLKNGRMISVRFQGKPFSITVIQIYAPTTNTKEAEVEWASEDKDVYCYENENSTFSFILRALLFY